MFQVTDAYKKTSYKTVKVMVWDGDAAKEEMPKHYVRFISEKYLDTLEKNFLISLFTMILRFWVRDLYNPQLMI